MRVLQFGGVKVAATTTVLVAAIFAAGCGGGSKQAATPAPATTAPATSSGPVKCFDAPAALIRKLEAHMVLAGATLTHVKTVAAPAYPGFYFVSGRITGGGAGQRVATWATPKLAGIGPVYAIDDSAALVSTYAGATGKSAYLTVDAPGVYKSRVCSGGQGVAPGQNAPPPGGGKPASK
jgi:hypothetical protein